MGAGIYSSVEHTCGTRTWEPFVPNMNYLYQNTLKAPGKHPPITLGSGGTVLINLALRPECPNRKLCLSKPNSSASLVVLFFVCKLEITVYLLLIVSWNKRIHRKRQMEQRIRPGFPSSCPTTLTWRVSTLLEVALFRYWLHFFSALQTGWGTSASSLRIKDLGASLAYAKLGAALVLRDWPGDQVHLYLRSPTHIAESATYPGQVSSTSFL